MSSSVELPDSGLFGYLYGRMKAKAEFPGRTKDDGVQYMATVTFDGGTRNFFAGSKAQLDSWPAEGDRIVVYGELGLNAKGMITRFDPLWVRSRAEVMGQGPPTKVAGAGMHSDDATEGRSRRSVGARS